MTFVLCTFEPEYLVLKLEQHPQEDFGILCSMDLCIALDWRLHKIIIDETSEKDEISLSGRVLFHNIPDFPIDPKYPLTIVIDQISQIGCGWKIGDDIMCVIDGHDLILKKF